MSQYLQSWLEGPKQRQKPLFLFFSMMITTRYPPFYLHTILLIDDYSTLNQKLSTNLSWINELPRKDFQYEMIDSFPRNYLDVEVEGHKLHPTSSGI
jgi:hypothetical protein